MSTEALQSIVGSGLEHALFELLVEGSADNTRVSWKRVYLDQREESLEWSNSSPLRF